MGLIKSDIRTRARSLLNEIVEGFWLDDELDAWIDDSALDISTKTHCYELSTDISLLTNTQLYNMPDTDYLKVLGVIYAHRGLVKTTPWMEGVQTAVQTGPPKFYFEIINKLGLFPIPTVTENATLATVYYSQAIADITKIPLKFKAPAVLFTMCMALIKERQYTRSGQLLGMYDQLLSLDKVDIQSENVEQPPPQSHYILKLSGPQK